VPEDVAKFYPPEHRDVDGQFASWRVWLSIIAYNTGLVKAEEAPKIFADLLDPKWKGKIAVDEKNFSWYGAMTQKWGKEKTQRYMRTLAKQDIQLRNGQTLIAQLMAAGEFSVAMVLAHRIEKMKEQGAPVEWVTTLDPVTASLHPIGIAAKAPHPNAAKLFVDFILSKDGQQLLLSIERTPARPGIDTKMEARKLKLFPMPPELGERYEQFQKELREIFGR
jgi:iron(III) transport system substrate-binding protein